VGKQAIFGIKRQYL